MDQPSSPSPCDRPAKKQCRVSQGPEDENKLQSHPQQSSNGTIIEPEVPVRTRGSLAAEFMKLLHYNDSLHQPSNCSKCTFACGNATSSNLPKRYDSRKSSDSFKSQMSG
ncbi:hypothetical protein CBS147333_10300 [Penicillium roqueforti]|nr:hypothetical protein CBS147333_10300 [Penicillium roqueforti]KAI3186698.1 hypothetical protein CBS147311_10259 [Penicillium roqueforti]KAI3260293.1 hypothetical protein CBS147308_10292 [Penicillium roqueforti]KAI3274860.1 hypothetical protein DTO003C3_10295 [Penicillium roqueforti]